MGRKPLGSTRAPISHFPPIRQKGQNHQNTHDLKLEAAFARLLPIRYRHRRALGRAKKRLRTALCHPVTVKRRSNASFITGLTSPFGIAVKSAK